jgi:hypothetical protein
MRRKRFDCSWTRSCHRPGRVTVGREARTHLDGNLAAKLILYVYADDLVK